MEIGPELTQSLLSTHHQYLVFDTAQACLYLFILQFVRVLPAFHAAALNLTFYELSAS